MGASKIDELVKVKKRSKGNGFVKSSAGKAQIRRSEAYSVVRRNDEG